MHDKKHFNLTDTVCAYLVNPGGCKDDDHTRLRIPWRHNPYDEVKCVQLWFKHKQAQVVIQINHDYLQELEVK